MDKILHISIVLLGVLWLVCDLYALENNSTPNYGRSDFFFNDFYAPNKPNATLGNSTNPYTTESSRASTWPNASRQPEENNGKQNKQDVLRSNQQLPENTDPAELRKFLQLLLSAFTLLNTDEEKQKDDYPEIKNSNPVDNQTERTTDIKSGNTDDIEFENFSGDDDNYDADVYDEDDNIADNNKKPEPINNNTKNPNPDNEPPNPIGVTENYLINNFDFDRFNSSPNTHIPPVKTEQNVTEFMYTYRNIPTESSVYQLPNERPVDELIPPQIENKMFETFIPYPFQRNIPENGFASEYVPVPNQFANSYLVPNQFVITHSNIPLDRNINQQIARGPNYPQAPTVTRESKVFDPYIQYNQGYIPDISYLSEYVPILPNQLPERKGSAPNITGAPSQKVPESQNSTVNPFRQYNPFENGNLETPKTVPRNKSDANINYNFQPMSTDNGNPKLVPIVSSMVYTHNNETRPQKNESAKFTSVPNTVYTKPEIEQSTLTSLLKTKPMNASANSEVRSIPVQLIRNIAPNLTNYDSKIAAETPRLDNATVSNFTVPNQVPQRTILNNRNSSVPVKNSTAPSNITPTSQPTRKFVIKQTPDNSSKSGDIPQNQSLPAEKNLSPFYLKGIALQFNISNVLLPKINNTNGTSTANPQNNVTKVNGTSIANPQNNVTKVNGTSTANPQNNVTGVNGISSTNSPPKEQQVITPIPLKIQTFTLSVTEPKTSPQPDSYEDYDSSGSYDDANYDEDEAWNGLLDLLEFMQDMMTNATVQTPQNTSDSTTSGVFPQAITPSNATTEIPQNASVSYNNVSVTGPLNPVNSSETTEYFKPTETFDSILEYIFKHSNNPLFTSLRAPGNATAQN